jgi:uncharacterized protein (DUF1778 family)
MCCVDDVYTHLYIECVYMRKAMATIKSRTGRDVIINLRANRNQRAVIDKAAERLGKNRSDFMLEAACREAEAVLLDQRYFNLDKKTFEKFTAALDRAPSENPRLRRLLRTKAPWE